MAAESRMAQDIADRQVAMFGMFVGKGCFTTRAALSVATKIPESTLKSYAAGAAMPLHAVLTLRKALPGQAINMLTEPGDAMLVDLQTTEANWDVIGCAAAGLVSEICNARSDGQIDHVENERLKSRTRALIAEAADMVSDG